MSPLGITLLMAAGFSGFAWLAWRKLAIVAALQPEVRWDHPVRRLKSVLVNGFLQQRMIAREPRAGVMHAVIFLGFMLLLLRKLQFFHSRGGIRAPCNGTFLVDRICKRGIIDLDHGSRSGHNLERAEL